jgi:hypothetical protein
MFIFNITPFDIVLQKFIDGRWFNIQQFPYFSPTVVFILKSHDGLFYLGTQNFFHDRTSLVADDKCKQNRDNSYILLKFLPVKVQSKYPENFIRIRYRNIEKILFYRCQTITEEKSAAIVRKNF